MMPGARAPVYVHDDPRSQAGRRLVLRGSDHQHTPRALLEENRCLAIENARLADENAALREAADLWIRLYEHQLARANAALRQKD